MPGSGLLGGRYRIEDSIGQGGMGVVYRAVDTTFRRSVAVKTIRGPVDEASLEQFRRESEALARLSHSNIIDIYGVGELSDKEGKKPYFVMPLLRGANLGDVLRAADSRLDPERLVGIICQACKGLQAAHNHNLIHRDLKPSNLFLLDDDSVKIIDFGIVHLAGKDSGAAMKGTLYYMAPEQLDGKPTAQSDIFSLGVVCYEALTGRKPFDGKTVTEVMSAIRSHIPPPIPDLNISVPYLLAKVVHRALAKQQYYRFSIARGRASHSGAAFLFLQDVEAKLSVEEVPYPKHPTFADHPYTRRGSSTGRLCQHLFHRAMLMMVYSTGMRRVEMCQLKVEDINSDRMLIHIRQGKERRDRDVSKLLETLRVYWHWTSRDVLSSGHDQRLPTRQTHRAQDDMEACREAAERASITNPCARTCFATASRRI